VSINEVADLIAGFSGKTVRKKYDATKPQGVRGRNSDNSRLRAMLGWEPETPLEVGLKVTYEWIARELRRSDHARNPGMVAIRT